MEDILLERDPDIDRAGEVGGASALTRITPEAPSSTRKRPGGLNITNSATELMNAYRTGLANNNSPSEPILDVYTEATRIQTSAEAERIHYLFSFFPSFARSIAAMETYINLELEKLEPKFLISDTRVILLKEFYSLLQTTLAFEASLQKLTNAEVIRRDTEQLNNTKGKIVSRVLNGLYNLNPDHPDFGTTNDPFWNPGDFPQKVFSASYWHETGNLQKALDLGTSGVTSVVQHLREAPGNVSQYRASKRTLDASMRQWFDKKANPHRYEDEATNEQNELTDSLNWLEEISVASMAHTVNKLDTIVSADNWKNSICGAVKMFAILQRIAIPEFFVGAAVGISGANSLIKDSVIGEPKVAGLVVGAALGASIPIVLNQDVRKEVKAIVNDIQSSKLTPAEKRKKLEELSGRVNDIEIIIKFLTWIKRVADLHAADTSRSLLTSSLNITNMIGAFIYPLLKEQLRKINKGWNTSTGAQIAAKGEVNSYREKLLVAREKAAKINRKTEIEIAVDALNDDTADHGVGDIFVKCLPIVELFDEVILPTIPNITKFLEDFLYQVYVLMQKQFAFSINLSNNLDVKDGKNWIDTILKWLEDNFGVLVLNPKFCTGIIPTQADIDSYVSSLAGSIESAPVGVGAETSTGISRLLLDPKGFNRRIDKLTARKRLNQLTADEETELKALNVVAALWAI